MLPTGGEGLAAPSRGAIPRPARGEFGVVEYLQRLLQGAPPRPQKAPRRQAVEKDADLGADLVEERFNVELVPLVRQIFEPRSQQPKLRESLGFGTSTHALLDEKQGRQALDEWDDEKGYWRNPDGHWGKLLRVSPSTILAARQGVTWKHLKHSNAGRKKEN